MIRPTTSFCLHPDVIEAIGVHATAAGLSRSRYVERVLAAATGLTDLAGEAPTAGPRRRRWLRR